LGHDELDQFKIIKMRAFIFSMVSFCWIAFVGLSTTSCAQSGNPERAVTIQELAKNFEAPMPECKPYTWWHWINGNITREGITKDLEWMKSYGIGGAIVFNVGMLGDDLPRKVPFGTDEWWQMVDHAIAESDRLGLKIGFHNCDGWSHSGGPWVDVDNSMKKMVWTEKFVSAGEKDIVLEQPETILDYYKDIAIYAVPVSDNHSGIKTATVTSNRKELNISHLLDDDPETFIDLKRIGKSEPVWFDFEFPEPTDIASVTLGINGMTKLGLSLEISVDGTNYRVLRTFNSHSKGSLGWRLQNMNALTFSFPRQSAKYFRVRIIENQEFKWYGIDFSESPKVDTWEIKAAHVYYAEHGAAAEYHLPDENRWEEVNNAIRQDALVDLTGKLGPDNRLDWVPPSGNWQIMRVGQTTNGKTNGPSTVEGRGLEADKLNPAALTIHYDGFMKKLIERDINKTTNSLAYSEIDSWEAGAQNWTDQFPEEFQKLNGYDMKPFFPVLTNGFVVDSYEISERFLWDYRKTLAYLIQNGCFSTLNNLLNKDGLTVFSEGSGRQAFMYDPINFQSTADIPKGEFWVGADMGANIPEGSPAGFMRPRIDCKVASSVAHIYGKQLAASESFTGGNLTFEQGPFDLKMLGDKAFCMGINWIVLHTSAHQPYDACKPGFSLGGAGSHFHRNNIVHEQNFGWLDYVARCQYLLRQGTFVADVLCYLGDDVPNYLGFRNELSLPLPGGYDYDGCNSDILLNHTSVKDGKIVLASGMEYRYLLLPGNPAITLEVLQKLQQLLKEGATLVGRKPVRTYGLKDYSEKDQAVVKLANELWGDCDGIAVKENAYGKGRIIWGKNFEEIAQSDKLIPDFQFTSDSENPEINFIHRKSGDADIYFIANGNYRDESITAKFRVKNKLPQFFLPGTGEIITTATYTILDDCVEMPVELPAAGSVFVVFSSAGKKPSIEKITGNSPAIATYKSSGSVGVEFTRPGSYSLRFSNGKSETVNVEMPEDIRLDGDWEIFFPLYHDSPGTTVQAPLFAWNSSDDSDIRYFSGTTNYKKSFIVPDGYLRNDLKLYLDLGDVQETARVKVNGKECAKLWMAPFKTDITGFLVSGENRVEVEVTNTLANRMIGDEFLPQDYTFAGRYIDKIPGWLDGKTKRPLQRVTFALSRFFSKDDKLVDSGLIGPVNIRVSSSKDLEF
jgi:hypothetical protein